MKKIISILMIMGISTGLATSALAQTRTPRINERQHEQRERITQGVESGRLTPVEAARLRLEEAKIRRTEAVIKADGEVTARERARLERELNHASQNIYRLKHNRRDR